jgi:alanine dehydrogenase
MLVAMALLAFFWSAALPLVETVTFDHLRDKPGHYSRIRLWGSIGFIVAVMGTGALLDSMPLPRLLWVIVGTLAGILVCALVVPEVAPYGSADQQLPVATILRQARVRALFAACFLMSAAHGALYKETEMHIGVPREIKNHEYRVGLTPSSVREMVAHGHQVTVETGAGKGIGATDEVYRKAGAVIADRRGDFCPRRNDHQGQGTAGRRACDAARGTDSLYLSAPRARSGAVCRSGQAAARSASPMKRSPSPAAACHCWRRCRKSPAACRSRPAPTASKRRMAAWVSCSAASPACRRRIVILGGGVVGSNAAQIAVGSGAQVVVIDRNIDVLRRMDRLLGARVITVFSNRDNVEQHVLRADLVIGGVLIPGAAAPKLVTRQMVDAMKPGSVIVDVAIDQGGCCETAKATTHAEPTYMVGNVVHYCVANMPGGVPRTSTYALNNATLPLHCRSPTRAGGRRCRTTNTCAMVSTSLSARSPAARSPKTSTTTITMRCR